MRKLMVYFPQFYSLEFDQADSKLKNMKIKRVVDRIRKKLRNQETSKEEKFN